MSASRIQKLEALLEQVQERRVQERHARVQEPPRGTPAKKPEATPLEAAMQDLGVVAPKPSSRPPKPTPAARPSAIPTPAKPQHAAPPKPKPQRPQPPQQPQQRPRPVKAEPAVVSLDPKPAAASGPVAVVASKPTATTPPTFGELLDRTLALRPR